MKLIIGLGNHETRYRETRHNVGALLIDSIADEHGVPLQKHQTNARIARAAIANVPVILAQPLCYMNESGGVVRSLQKFYDIPTKDIIVCYDDIDIPFGAIRVGHYTSSGGHHGVQSIIAALHARTFTRVRLGIGPQTGPAETYVLKGWSSSQKKALPKVFTTARDALAYALQSDGPMVRTDFHVT